MSTDCFACKPLWEALVLEKKEEQRLAEEHHKLSAHGKQVEHGERRQQADGIRTDAHVRASLVGSA